MSGQETRKLREALNAIFAAFPNVSSITLRSDATCEVASVFRDRDGWSYKCALVTQKAKDLLDGLRKSQKWLLEDEQRKTTRPKGQGK